ncbi:MAG: hypothetical protein IPP71_21855 [Bacteroidetes bacterium]|nr:hypothetical protein [Bacteroidota bacterium]
MLINLAEIPSNSLRVGLWKWEQSCKINSDNCEIEFDVTDTGIGIAPEKLNSIFESFTQANSEINRKYGGTGLGPTISKQLVDLQGGKIGLESKMGLGTRFYFTLEFQLIRMFRSSRLKVRRTMTI